MKPKPLIGLTTYRNLNSYSHPQISIAEAYTRAVSSAGGLPVAVPLGLGEADLEGLLTRLEGIIFTGGGDVEPQRYGSSPHPLVDAVDADRDRVELFLLEQTLRRRLPFLGICRGLQVLNVGLGGTLYEDILDQHAGAMQHQYSPDWPRDYLAHTVKICRGTLLSLIIGRDVVGVNSLHHQGIRRLADGLAPTAYAPDGLVEAVELHDYSFGLAVQWHPEWLTMHQPMQMVFSNFIQAAENGSNGAHP